jgi:non-heme chloroperoxidase
MNHRFFFVAALLLLVPQILSAQQSVWRDPSPHRVQFLTVDTDVRLEVLDWGGTGKPIVLLSGQGNTAHIFDEFAPKLISDHHVYGITRRGYGASSRPVSGYSADRLGDDILAVLDALKLDRPVLMGHSIGGEELSSIATRHPEKVAGLVYLDAAYAYAYYDASRGDLNIDLQDLVRKLDLLQPGRPLRDPQKLGKELLEESLPNFQKILQRLSQTTPPPPQPAPPEPTTADRDSYRAWREWQQRTMGFSMPEAELRQLHETTPEGHVGPVPGNPSVQQAMIMGQQKYTALRVPILAIFALPHSPGAFAQNDPKLPAYEAWDMSATGAQAQALESGIPSARVVRLPNANHYVFLSHEADVLREIRTFLQRLI